MLIVTRIDERIMIGLDVSVTVLAISGAQIRLGLDAPRDVDVHREEVYRRIKHQRALERDKPTSPVLP